MTAKRIHHGDDPGAVREPVPAGGASLNPSPERDVAPDYLSRDYFLATLRAATFRARLAQAELEVVGMAVKGGWMTPLAAFDHLESIGAIEYLPAEMVA